MSNLTLMLKNGYAICPNEWLNDDNLKSKGLLELLLRISSLTAKEGFCFASNAYFAEKIGQTEVSVSRKLNDIESAGYITREYERRGAEITKRKIRLTQWLIDDQPSDQSTVNCTVKDNSTSIKSISNNTNTDAVVESKSISNNSNKSSPSGQDSEKLDASKSKGRVKEVVDILNSVIDSQFRHQSAKTIACVNARFNEGFTVEDFRSVIDKKAAEWIGTEYEKYLRPDTLFGTKFEGYLMAKTTKSKSATATRFSM